MSALDPKRTRPLSNSCARRKWRQLFRQHGLDQFEQISSRATPARTCEKTAKVETTRSRVARSNAQSPPCNSIARGASITKRLSSREVYVAAVVRGILTIRPISKAKHAQVSLSRYAGPESCGCGPLRRLSRTIQAEAVSQRPKS
jgi:transposase-like protein